MLIKFLNMILEDHEIVEVDFIPTEHLGLTDEDRKVIFDLSCRCHDGESIIIEMQKGFQKHFRKRALYYTTYPINEQARNARNCFLKEKTEGNAVCSDRGWERLHNCDIFPAIHVTVVSKTGTIMSERYFKQTRHTIYIYYQF